MREIRRRDEGGQALIVAVLVMVGLLAMTGLALDGGAAYLERRRLQNAADAVVVAGARKLILSYEPWINDDVIHETMHDYAVDNGVEDLPNNLSASYVDQDGVVLQAVGVGSVPLDSTGISATVRSERATRLMHLIGIERVPVSARSMAQTGPPDMKVGAIPDEGIRPFGVPSETLKASGTFTICFDNKCDDGSACTIEYREGDEDKSQSHRGWWNYNEIDAEKCSSTGGASDLQEWMENGWSVSDLTYVDKVCSKQGVNASVFAAAPLDEPAYVPVYDCFDDGRYHVVGFAEIQMLETSGKCIKAEFVDTDVMLGHGQADPGGEVFNTVMITLWE